MSLTFSTKAWWALVAFLFLALVAQFTLLYPRLRVKDAEISALQATLQARDQRGAERETAEQLQAQHQELTRLRKDNQELHRLRNEVRQLREANQRITQAAPAPPAAEPGAAAAELVVQLQRQVQQLQFENAELRAAEQHAIPVQDRAQLLHDFCLNNLRQLDGAKEQWALENRQPAGALPEPADIEPYLRDAEVMICPSGGLYLLGAVGIAPTCSIPGHELP